MPTDQPRPLPPCRLDVIHAATDEAGRYLALPGCRLRGRWQAVHGALVEWGNVWPRPMPTPAEWAELVAAMRQARRDEALARAAVG